MGLIIIHLMLLAVNAVAKIVLPSCNVLGLLGGPR